MACTSRCHLHDRPGLLSAARVDRPFAPVQRSGGSDREPPRAGGAGGIRGRLRWLTQREVVVIPKSIRPERMAENVDVFGFQLTDDRMAQIASLDTGVSVAFDHRDPAWVTRLNNAAS